MRHGQVRYFTGSDPTDADFVELTERGRAQAAEAGRLLHGSKLDRVITSHLPRTIETARVVLTVMGVLRPPEIEQWPDLEEFRGRIPEDIAEDEIDDAFLPIFRGIPSRDDAFLGGETVGSMIDRVNAMLDKLLADDWETALMVLHGGTNRAILSRALTGEPSFLGHIEQSPGCLNIIDIGPDWYVRTVNVTPLDLAHELRTTTIEELVADYRAFRGSAGSSPNH